MRVRTALALFFGLFNAVWLFVLFYLLFMEGSITIHEHNRAIAAFEMMFLIMIFVITLERIINLRERRSKTPPDEPESKSKSGD